MRPNHPDFIIRPQATVLEALRIIDRNGCGVAIIVERTGRFVGILTEGDLRRLILKGLGLKGNISEHVNRDPFVVEDNVSRLEVLEIMKSRGISQVPVVKSSGEFVGVHFLREMIGGVERPNFAIVLAGGFGTRLGPLTKTVPKPMLKVAGRPLLERIVYQIISAGLKRIFIAVHYLPEKIIDHFGDGEAFGCQIQYLNEAEPMGTAGCLHLLPSRPSHDFLLLNGDVLSDVPLGPFLDHHMSLENDATLVVKRHDTKIPFGCVEEKEGRILRMVEKPTITHKINAGVYALHPSVLDLVPRGFTHITSVLEELIEADRKVGAFHFEEEWIDIGRPNDLALARGERTGD